MAHQQSIVLDLQQMASESSASVSELLRKALIVATKLKIKDFREWVADELSGYTVLENTPPPYRIVNAELEAYNPNRGYIPLMCKNIEYGQKLRITQIRNPLPELEAMLTNESHFEFYQNFSADVERRLMNGMDALTPMRPRKSIPRNRIVGAVGAVRTIVLEWSLKLEEEGILGEGMSFSDDEKRKAAQASSIHVAGDFHGILGNVTAHNLQIGDFGQIHQQLKDAGVSQMERNELENITDELKTAKTEDRGALLKRGMEWVKRNGPLIGGLASIIDGWFHH